MHTYIPTHTGKTKLPESQPRVPTLTQANNINVTLTQIHRNYLSTLLKYYIIKHTKQIQLPAYFDC